MVFLWFGMAVAQASPPGFGVADVSALPGRGEQVPMAMLRPAKAASATEAVEPPDDAAPWAPQALGIRPLGFSDEGVWTRARLANPGRQAMSGWLVVTEPFADWVDCVVTSPRGETTTYRMGDHRPYAERPIPHPRFILPLTWRSGETLEVRCYIRNQGAMLVAFEYWQPANFWAVERKMAMAKFLGYGAVLLVICCGVLGLLVNRIPAAMLLVIELVPLLMGTLAGEGDAFEFLWPAHPAFNLPPFMWTLTACMAGTVVVNRILPLARIEKFLVKLVVATALSLMLLAVAIPMSQPLGAAVNVLPLGYLLLLVALCLRHWRGGHLPRILAVGVGAQALGLVGVLLGVLGVLGPAARLSALFASVVKAMSLAVALAYRMRVEREQGLQAQQAHTRELEQRLAYESQLRHVATHHLRYGLPNQALLDEALRRATLTPRPLVLSLWVIRLNRLSFLESILPRERLAKLVEGYASTIAEWLQGRDDLRLLTVENALYVVALDDGTLAFASVGQPPKAAMVELTAFLTHRYEQDGLFIAWDPHVGVSCTPSEQNQAHDMIDEARVALQWSNAHQRVVMFDAERMKREQLSYGLTLDLEGAIVRGELVLHYQPKVDLPSRQTKSFEALVRWRHPVRGMIPPGAFIAEAEATGAINRLTMWAIRETARFLLTLPDPDVRVSVNISAFDLATPRFVEQVLAILREEHCPPERLILEVTESAALSDRERALGILSALRRAGVQIALDDFGTGYSSLAILQELPLDEVKVDRSFVTDLKESQRKQEVLKAMIDVGHRLGLTVTIEGVEQEDSVDWLTLHGCDVIQGFVFSRPLEAQVARQWLQAQQAVLA
ncbi:EAL domain-containing protein [Aquabacterium sp.]|uniref:EAL domain-containing protein n=1 Tax=Aquabacterium sp. TaxID=1872578 RepID=UPI003D6D684B